MPTGANLDEIHNQGRDWRRLDCLHSLKFFERGKKTNKKSRTELRLLLELVLNVQRVRAARVGPAQRKRDLGGRALLQQQLALRVEEEDGEGAVQQTGLDVAHQVACATRTRADDKRTKYKTHSHIYCNIN
jgi:hypothetical protein